MSEVPIKPAWIRRLDDGLKTLDLSLPAEVSKQLLQFIALLIKWNRAYNLTAIKDPLEMVDRHLIDSLSILGYVQGSHILDMGTGPGLPGIPLALALPESRFVLLDSNRKKIRFVRQAMMELGLENIQPVQARIESYHSELPFDCLISRAFTSLPNMLALTKSVLGEHTRLLAMKGSIPQDEIDQITPQYQATAVALKVPARLGERHLIVISKST
ncbi:MAG: 16S rRNA (guanine(527)-N(7))-methyltransferase RsmG [Pseudomonadota bacterium]